MAGATIGKDVRICSSALIVGAGHLEIGDHSWIGHRVTLSASSSIRIGAHVDIAPQVYIGNGSHRLTPKDVCIAGQETTGDVAIGDGCWIGAQAVILPGVSVGEKCVVAAGAVVVQSCESLKMLAGVPAHIKREL